MKQFKTFLTEYLTDEQRKRYSDVKMSSQARTATDHFFGKDNDHVREDVLGLEPDKSEVHRAVERHLGKEIPVHDYVKGMTKDNHGRDVKLGRQIRDEKLRTQFANDNTRAGSKSTSGHYMTIVRGTEVAGQTNSAPDALHPKGHSWGDQSCKNVDNGSNRHYLEDEVKHGTVVVRAHDHTGQEIYRATLQPHLNRRLGRAYAIDSEYGLKHPSFTAHAHDVASRLSREPTLDDPIHSKHVDVYDDNDVERILHPNLRSHHLDKLIDHDDAEVRELIPNHPNVTSAHLTTLSDDHDDSVRRAVTISPRADQRHLDKLLNDRDGFVVSGAAKNPNLSDSSLTHILSDNTPLDKRSNIDKHRLLGAAKNPSLRAHHFDIIKNKDSIDHFAVKNNAAMNHAATEDYLLHSVESHQPPLLATNAAYNPSATKSVLDRALDHPKSGVRYAATENHKMTPELLHKALNDSDTGVKISALLHPKIDNTHIAKALDDKDDDVAVEAAKHSRISSENLQKALNHSSSFVRNAAKRTQTALQRFK